ncbi:MAG: hypothetical protein II685_01830 [Clostridia bacterium]|nr:hypothetical protein [Clostridia bacterium]
MIDTYKLRAARMTEKDYRDELLETLESLQNDNIQYKSIGEWIEAAKLTVDIVRSLYYFDNGSG